jgi:predicted HAD superfamily Cof-like phosphohydrolase
MDHYMQHIKVMHEKFQIEGEFTQEEKDFRYECMLEEVNEYRVANNREDELDALVDLAVFLFGTVDRMGFNDNFYRAYVRVSKANLEKELGPNNKRGGFKLDLRKPEGWVPPNLSDLV